MTTVAESARVWLQAASDAPMILAADIENIQRATSYGAEAGYPLIETKSAMNLLPGDTVYLANTSTTPSIDGTYTITNVNASGSTANTASAYTERSFYIDTATILDPGSAPRGTAYVTLADDDPRKMYGLPYQYVGHDRLVPHPTGKRKGGFNWGNIGKMGGRGGVSNIVRVAGAFIDADHLTGTPKPGRVGGMLRQRTYWDWVAPTASDTLHHDKASKEWENHRGKSLGDDVSGGFRAIEYFAMLVKDGPIPGYGFGDSGVSYKRIRANIRTVLASAETNVGAQVICSSPHHLKNAGEIFTAYTWKGGSAGGSGVTLPGLTFSAPGTSPTLGNGTPLRVVSIPNIYTINVHQADGGGGSGFICTGTGSAPTNVGSKHGAYIIVQGSATQGDDYLTTPARMPTTTKFELHTESIDYNFSDKASLTPISNMASVSGLNEQQMNMIGMSFGNRTETIRLAGTLVDRGPVSSSNIRKQPFLNIARTQWAKILGIWGGGQPASHTLGRGGSGATNPRSYPCLTIYDPSLMSSDSASGLQDTNPDGSFNIYRGLIKSLNFTQVGDRPNIWQWSMDFHVIQNEKMAVVNDFDE